MTISSNRDNSNEFSLNSGNYGKIVFPLKQLKNVKGKGILNSFQKTSITKEQLRKIEEDKKLLGGT